jgi:hypothetical protein
VWGFVNLPKFAFKGIFFLISICKNRKYFHVAKLTTYTVYDDFPALMVEEGTLSCIIPGTNGHLSRTNDVLKAGL